MQDRFLFHSWTPKAVFSRVALPLVVKILLLLFIRWNKNWSYTEKVKYPLYVFVEKQKKKLLISELSSKLIPKLILVYIPLYIFFCEITMYWCYIDSVVVFSFTCQLLYDWLSLWHVTRTTNLKINMILMDSEVLAVIIVQKNLKVYTLLQMPIQDSFIKMAQSFQ